MSRPAAPAGAFLRGLGLGILAVSQPLYALLAAQPGFFAARAADSGDILAVALLALLPALNWGAVAALAAALGRGAAADAASAGLAAALLAGQGAASLPSPAWAAACLAAGAAAVWAARREPAREFLTWASAAALLLPCLFLLRAPWPGAAAPPLPAAAGAKPTRVVFVVFDEFPLATLLDRDGGVDPLWFPSFARLAREGAWYREARSPSDDTFKAVPTLLTGTYAKPPKAPWHRDYPRNLFTELAGTHRLSAVETHTALCPPELCRPRRPDAAARLAGLAEDLAVLFAHRAAPRAWASALPSVGHSWKGFRRGGEEFSWDALNAAAGESYLDRVGVFRRFAREAAAPGRPALHFIHTMLPHPPWVHLPSGAPAFTPNEPIVLGDRGREDRWEDDPDLVAAAWQRHILQARAVDRLLGDLLDGLKNAGAWEDALVVVAADHGAAFRAGGRRRALTPETAGEVVPVPLFVKYPGDGPRGPQERAASLADVLPTVLEVQGLPLPPGLDGTGLRGPGRPPEFIAKDGSRAPAVAGWKDARRESDRRRALLGDGRDPDGLYRLGPAGAAVGRSVAELRRANEPPCRATLHQSLIGATAYSKAYLSGSVECSGGNAGRRGVLAVVDGAVVAAGVTGPVDAGGAAPLRLMLPEEAVRTDAVPQLFLASGAGRKLEVATLIARGATWRLDPGALVSSEGRVCALGEPRAGARAAARAEKDVLVLTGDARRAREGRHADAVVVFKGGAFVFAGRPDRASGRFDFALPRDLAGGDGPLRLFGVSDPEAGGGLPEAWELLE